MPLDLEQLRARHAFAAAARAGRNETYLRQARKLPAMLQINGLLAALAFLCAKSEAEAVRRDLLAHLRSAELGTLAELARRLAATFGLADGGAVTEAVPGPAGDEPLRGLDLRRLTAEAIVYAGWLKRAAETLCDGEDDAAPATDQPGPAPPGPAGSPAAAPPASPAGAPDPEPGREPA